ncbi:hypothetical protein TNCT_601841 [Trichonephila clavata]|uniref:Sushi domain-containing protein n=1 Tax=Trichonephila clavata TaxID=2740835 RepID=A0A8X6H5G8_TRICU|nr:hypothetical protein TNCT_601841 [Trichonephila clavata]
MSCKDRSKALVGKTRRWTCLSDGQWSGHSLPRCKAQCPIIDTEHLTIIYSSRLLEGSSATFSCPPTHVLSGVNRTICTRNGEWADPIPTCSRTDIPKPEGHPVNKKKCPNISDENLLVDHSRHLTEGSVATFHCPSTYVLSGVSRTICTRSGEWADPIPKCLRPHVLWKHFLSHCLDS